MVGTILGVETPLDNLNNHFYLIERNIMTVQEETKLQRELLSVLTEGQSAIMNAFHTLVQDHRSLQVEVKKLRRDLNNLTNEGEN